MGDSYLNHESSLCAVWALLISKIVLGISKEVKSGKVKRRNTRDGKKHDSAKEISVEKQKRIILYSKRDDGDRRFY